MRIGVHNSINGGLLNVIEEIRFLKTNTTQFFIHSPRTWGIDKIDETQKNQFIQKLKELNINPVIVHSSYLINPLSSNREVIDRSK